MNATTNGESVTSSPIEEQTFWGPDVYEQMLDEALLVAASATLEGLSDDRSEEEPEQRPEQEEQEGARAVDDRGRAEVGAHDASEATDAEPQCSHRSLASARDSRNLSAQSGDVDADGEIVDVLVPAPELGPGWRRELLSDRPYYSAAWL